MLPARTLLLVVLLAVLARPGAQGDPSIVGSWRFQDGQTVVVAEFSADRTFRRVVQSPLGQERLSGSYSWSGSSLVLRPTGAPEPIELACALRDRDTLVLTDADGERVEMRRVAEAGDRGPVRSKGWLASRLAKASGAKPTVVLFERVAEPREKAFTLLRPRGWSVEGGVFNVNPLQANGPGNSISPKCDLTVARDERGTVMVRWIPTWNHADLTFSPTGGAGWQPGQHYQGMPVKSLPTPKEFLLELLQSLRPQAENLRVVAEDPLPELVEAFARQAAATNQRMAQIGVPPITSSALAIVAEYDEGPVRYREVLQTAIVDARGGAFQWSNESTIVLRAPAAEFDACKPVLDTIRLSLETNPEWLAAVTRAMGERARAALDTQRYVSRVAAEIVENRRRTHAEIRHEQWLFVTGQDEYANPFTGRAELGSNRYRYRWVNQEGSVLYTDENSFDPNEHEEYKTREWKRTPVRQR